MSSNLEKPLPFAINNVEFEKLLEQNELLDATELIAQIGHCRWDYENSRLISCSQGYARIFNMSVEEVIALQSSWGQSMSQVLPEDRDKYLAAYYVQQEIAEREVISSELENKNAELEHFAYTVSHDLKTPLVTIKGFLGLLDKDLAAQDMDRAATDMTKINLAADTMVRLLEELLELSRIGRVVFELFERLSQDVEGTGVGLTLVKRIVEVHGGTIWVESDGLVQGCTILFTLPGPP